MQSRASTGDFRNRSAYTGMTSTTSSTSLLSTTSEILGGSSVGDGDLMSTATVSQQQIMPSFPGLVTSSSGYNSNTGEVSGVAGVNISPRHQSNTQPSAYSSTPGILTNNTFNSPSSAVANQIINPNSVHNSSQGVNYHRGSQQNIFVGHGGGDFDQQSSSYGQQGYGSSTYGVNNSGNFDGGNPVMNASNSHRTNSMGVSGMSSIIESGYDQHFVQDEVAEGRKARKDSDSALRQYEKFMFVAFAFCAGGAVISLITLGSRSLYVLFVLTVCAAAFYFVFYLLNWIFSRESFHPKMNIISDAIREGSEGFLSTQYGAIASMAGVFAAVLATVYLFRNTPGDAVGPLTQAIMVALSFLIGAGCSAIAGYIGVWISVRVNVRVSIAASKSQYGESLLLAFRGGAVSAALSAAFCICGVTVLYLVCHLFFVQVIGAPSTSVPMMLAGYGFGASFVALFMQLGGGIYTKAADVGADMIGKVESNIPEDDPRNPAVIADLVGDNVGDCAGSMADIFESIAGEVIGTMILGSTLAHEGGLGGAIDGYMFFPLVVHAFDLIISGFGILTMHVRGDEDPLEPMKRSYVHCMGIAIVIFWATARFMLHTPVAPDAWWHFALCGMVGIVMSYLLILSTQYYTDYKHDPVKSIARASLTGHGTNVIQGIAVGLESCGFPVLIIVAGLLSSYTLGSTSGLPSIQAGIYGTAVATMGMLCTAVFVLSMNNFGPIADNAGGIVEMSEQPDHIRKITDRLDAVGNVTKAASKGYAVGGSALACFVLFQAFLDEISLYIGSHYGNVNIARMEVMLGGILGIMMIFVFTGWAMSSVGRTAQEVVWEVRNQFKEFPGIMAGTQKPDYNRCVSIVTKAALKEMIKPAVLALGAPISVGLFFRYVGYLKGEKMLGVEVVASFVIFATLTGLLMAIFMDNAGGAWDNAKKYIESQDKKGSEEHKAAVTGDTVGDPFKDTAGPSLHVIIATMSTTVLVLGPLFINQ